MKFSQGLATKSQKKEEREKKLILEDWLNEELIPRFQSQILVIDVEVVLTWGRVFGEKKQSGLIIPIADGLIAATAIVHNLTVVTENINDFIETGARVFNPWLN